MDKGKLGLKLCPVDQYLLSRGIPHPERSLTSQCLQIFLEDAKVNLQDTAHANCNLMIDNGVGKR